MRWLVGILTTLFIIITTTFVLYAQEADESVWLGEYSMEITKEWLKEVEPGKSDEEYKEMQQQLQSIEISLTLYSDWTFSIDTKIDQESSQDTGTYHYDHSEGSIHSFTFQLDDNPDGSMNAQYDESTHQLIVYSEELRIIFTKNS